ncbi:MAG: hypothetical protein KAJ07_12280 [Planctomycetes bacterium]|nr:hypothetical protein [Planctomycetota bacterium]
MKDVFGNETSTPLQSANIKTLDINGNIDADPLFVNAGNGDYRLAPNSPCIDFGYSNNDYTGQTDVDGNSHVIDIAGIGDGVVDVDMGAYEYSN